MSAHSATVVWERPSGVAFKDNKYSRAHEWRFDGGTVVQASSSPSVVPLPMSRPDAVDPEEAFVASLSSCHMLFFLFHAAKAGFVVDHYEDDAVGETGKNSTGAVAMLRVRLRPRVTWADNAPAAEQLADFHHRAHESCYIANSVTADIAIEPR